ncbi:MAG: 50S ribosomal protein L9 [Pelagibacterales bacterium]|nr:50S ribosomal protein L9 [Pelagibacterales bacterium]OUU62244.1 MAG: 50S ribosomal protein L9 [Alphaproteobacteria bacterium TMED62]|tara:strand:- start:10354 stop:10815 length:462 start_codon:yes stop_codon:yes gene_type:complete
MINIILLEKISKLGNIGEIVKVKDGFARNYLLPNKKAIRASEDNKKVFDQKKEELVKINEEKIAAAKEALKKLPANITIFREASEQGALFGSVTSRDIAKEIKTDNFEISAKDIILKFNIKNIGEYLVEVILHPEVSQKINIIVKKSEESLSN